MKELDLTQLAFAFELYLTRKSTKNAVTFTNLSKFPSVRRDISVLIDKEIAVESIIDCIKNSSNDLLDNLELFDVYQGEGIDLEKKSLALGLTFQRSSSTLIDKEVEDLVENILKTLHSDFGATLRE